MCAFRSIRPSQSDKSSSSNPSQSSDWAEKSTATSNPSRSASESASSELQPRPEKRPQAPGVTSKRRRVPENVTRNACVNCKKARAKCDGQKPCSRCSTRADLSPCVYEVHVKHAKEELVKQIKELEGKDQKLGKILGALAANDRVPEILQRLRNGYPYENIVDFIGRASTDNIGSHSPQPSSSAFESSDLDQKGTIPLSRPASFQWTTVTSDSAIIDHLFQLYFAWVHPVHTLFSETHFFECYKNRTLEYCSPVLVNAICALACHLHTHDDADEVDFEHLETSFSDAVRMAINPDNRDLCTTQAFAVMFLVECARSQALRASAYLSVASCNLSEVVIQDIPDFLLVVQSTTQGVRYLNVEWGQITFRAPDFSPVALIGTANSELMQHLDNAPWYFYRYITDQCPAWPALSGTTNREKGKLIEINRDVTLMMYGPAGHQITAHMILEQYGRYLQWRENLPATIGTFEDNNDQPLPHVVSLLILYSSSVVQLLQPLLDLPGFPTAIVEEIVWANIQEGLFLVEKHYRTRYTCRYQPVFQMFAILLLCDSLVRHFPEKSDVGALDWREAVSLGTDALLESQAGMPISGPLQALLKRSAEHALRPQVGKLDDLVPLRPGTEYSMDDFIDACTRPSYHQPVADIRQKFEVSFIENWRTEAPALSHRPSAIETKWRQQFRSEEERGAQHLMQIRNLLNDG